MKLRRTFIGNLPITVSSFLPRKFHNRVLKLGSVSYLNDLNILFEQIRERTLVSRKDNKMTVADFSSLWASETASYYRKSRKVCSLFWEKSNLSNLPVGQQGPEFNGYLVGRGNFRDIDLNRNFPDLNALMYYYEKTKGRNHHLPLPDNWEQQVSGASVWERSQNLQSLFCPPDFTHKKFKWSFHLGIDK